MLDIIRIELQPDHLTVGEDTDVDVLLSNVSQKQLTQIMLSLRIDPRIKVMVDARLKVDRLAAGQQASAGRLRLRALEAGDLWLRSTQFSWINSTGAEMIQTELYLTALPKPAEVNEAGSTQPSAEPPQMWQMTCGDELLVHDLFLEFTSTGNEAVCSVRARSDLDHRTATAKTHPLDMAALLPFTTRWDHDWSSQAALYDAAVHAGTHLFESVFTGGVRDLISRYVLDDISRQQHRLRLRIDLERAPEVWRSLPWEYLHHQPSREFLVLLSGELSIVRDIPSLHASEFKPASLDEGLHLLIGVASPANLEPLNVDDEVQRIHEALAGIPAHVDVIEQLTFQKLHDTLRARPRTHVFHYIGHGVPESQGGGLAFEDDSGCLSVVNGAMVATLLRQCPSLNLVFLNACHTASGTGTAIHTSTTASLIGSLGLPAAIGMDTAIYDDSARRFSQDFYQAVAAGCPLDYAVHRGRMRLFSSTRQDVDWGTPVLGMHGDVDGYLFDLPSRA